MILTIEQIIELAEMGMPTFLVIIGILFAYFQLWPWWKVEREFQRSHKEALLLKSIEVDMALSGAINDLSVSVKDCPYKVEVPS